MYCPLAMGGAGRPLLVAFAGGPYAISPKAGALGPLGAGTTGGVGTTGGIMGATAGAGAGVGAGMGAGAGAGEGAEAQPEAPPESAAPDAAVSPRAAVKAGAEAIARRARRRRAALAPCARPDPRAMVINLSERSLEPDKYGPRTGDLRKVNRGISTLLLIPVANAGPKFCFFGGLFWVRSGSHQGEKGKLCSALRIVGGGGSRNGPQPWRIARLHTQSISVPPGGTRHRNAVHPRARLSACGRFRAIRAIRGKKASKKQNFGTRICNW